MFVLRIIFQYLAFVCFGGRLNKMLYLLIYFFYDQHVAYVIETNVRKSKDERIICKPMFVLAKNMTKFDIIFLNRGEWCVSGLDYYLYLFNLRTNDEIRETYL